MPDFKDQLKSIKPKGRITFRHRAPGRAEASYRKALRGIILDLAKEINREVKPLLTQELKADERQDGLGDVLRRLRGLLTRSLSGEAIAQRIAEAVRRNTDSNISRAISRAIGVDIAPPGSDLSDLIDGWVEENTLLIKDLRDTHVNRVRNVISNGFRDGLSSREIARQINEQTGIGLRRAKLIARDQVGTLNGQVTKQRDEDLGVDRFVWRTARDIRVRGNPSGLYPRAKPSHWDREGKEYSWEKGANGEFPGTPINCRCFAEAVLSWD